MAITMLKSGVGGAGSSLSLSSSKLWIFVRYQRYVYSNSKPATNADGRTI